MTNMDLSNPPGDNAFLHDLELTVQTELTMAGTSQAVEEADGEPGDERLPDTHVEHYVVRLRTLLGAIEASEDDFRTRLRAPLGAAGEDRLRPASLADAYVARGTPTAQQGG